MSHTAAQRPILHALHTGAAVGALAAAAAAQDVPINPKGTYLRTNNDPQAANPTVVDLAARGLNPGQWVRLTRLGLWSHAAGQPEAGSTLLGVFSAGSTVLAFSQPHRVPGALAAGEPWISAPTHFGTLPTDIPEDFAIDNGVRSSIVVHIPGGATHLLLGPHDSYFGDNTDPNGDYKCRLERVPPPCYADCDTSTGVGVLDIFDFLCFQNRYAAQEPYACECDISTGPGVCDIFDFLCFQNAYAAGCP